jgi:2-oxoglutarate dehydrogenase E2 component (dihydrolipoamide succinyltransferase)
MAVDVVMPQMGVSVSEGTVSRWVKGVGEQIEADETIVEISTDKVDTEVPSPGAGVISEILVQEGETVAVGTKLAVIGGDPTETSGQTVTGSEGSSDAVALGPSEAPAAPPPSPEAPGTAPESPAAAATAQQASGSTAAAPAAAEPAPHFGPGTSDGG